METSRADSIKKHLKKTLGYNITNEVLFSSLLDVIQSRFEHLHKLINIERKAKRMHSDCFVSMVNNINRQSQNYVSEEDVTTTLDEVQGRKNYDCTKFDFIYEDIKSEVDILYEQMVYVKDMIHNKKRFNCKPRLRKRKRSEIIDSNRSKSIMSANSNETTSVNNDSICTDTTENVAIQELPLTPSDLDSSKMDISLVDTDGKQVTFTNISLTDMDVTKSNSIKQNSLCKITEKPSSETESLEDSFEKESLQNTISVLDAAFEKLVKWGPGAYGVLLGDKSFTCLLVSLANVLRLLETLVVNCKKDEGNYKSGATTEQNSG